MANKIKLDLEPGTELTFKNTVPIPTPDGKALKIEFEFKARDRVEFARFQDEQAELSRAFVEQFGNAEQLATDDVTNRLIARDVAVLKSVAVGWNVEGAPFDEETLAKFCRKYPAGAVAVATHYRVSLTEGRLGN